MRGSICDTGLISPFNATSPIKTDLSGTGLSFKLEIIAARIARSKPGSVERIPAARLIIYHWHEDRVLNSSNIASNGSFSVPIQILLFVVSHSLN